MRIASPAALAFASLLLCSAPSIAQNADLIGTWSAEPTILLESEGEIKEVPRKMTIVITQVDGSLVQGVRTWEAETDTRGFVGNVPLLEASEPFLGAITSDGKRIRLVEIEDEGLLLGERLGPDEIEFTYMEAAPHAVVYSAIFKRVE